MSEVKTSLLWGIGEADDGALDDLDDLYDTFPGGLTRGEGYLGVEVGTLDGLYAFATLTEEFAEDIVTARDTWRVYRASCRAAHGVDPGEGALLLCANEAT